MSRFIKGQRGQLELIADCLDDLFLDLLLRRVFVRDFFTFKKIPEQRKKTNWREFLGRLPLLNHLQKS